MTGLLYLIRSRPSLLTGSLLLLAVLLSILSGIGAVVPSWFSGAVFWLAGLRLVGDIAGIQRWQTLALLTVGLLGMGYALFKGDFSVLLRALSGNQGLLAMLAAVTFLRLVTVPTIEDCDHLPTGKGPMWRTIFGVHLFGAVINISALMIIADRQSLRRPLTNLQAMSLSQAFGMAAYWSPFFAAMGVALHHAPGASFAVMSLSNLPVALLGLLLCGLLLSRQAGIDEYRGYPMHFGALWVPACLAVGVLLAHHYFPAVPIISFISLLSLLLTMGLLLLRERGGAAHILRDHIETRLPGMSRELWLFLAAGVFAAGLNGLVRNLGWELALSEFGPLQAWLVLCLSTAVAIVGVHPIISVATVSSLVLPLQPDPTLLGVTFLMMWMAGVTISPLSGTQLTLQGRYGINNWQMFRANRWFVLLMLLIDGLALQLYGVLTR